MTKAPIVDYLGTCRFHLNFRTALWGVRRHLKKKPIEAKSNGYLTQCSPSRPLDTPCPCGQHFAVFWLAVQFLVGFSCKAPSVQCATRRGFCEICSLLLFIILDESMQRTIHVSRDLGAEESDNQGQIAENDRKDDGYDLVLMDEDIPVSEIQDLRSKKNGDQDESDENESENDDKCDEEVSNNYALHHYFYLLALSFSLMQHVTTSVTFHTENTTQSEHRKSGRGQSCSSRIHQCPHCTYSSNTAQHLRYHIRTHTGEKPYFCEKCRRYFSRSSHYNRHLLTKVHSAVKITKINITREQLESNATEQLQTNATEQLQTNATEQLQINATEQLLGTNASERLETNASERLETNASERLETNASEQLETNAREQLETNASEQLETNATEQLETNASEQLETNATEQSEANGPQGLKYCPHCPYSTKRVYCLKLHLHTHSGEKPYSCSKCGRCFTRPDKRNAHMRKVHSATNEEIASLKVIRKKMEKKLLKCPHCPFSTKRVYCLKLHLHTHSGEKPYSCSKCAQCFTRPDLRNRHMRKQHSATNEEIYSLKSSGKTFGVPHLHTQ